MGIEIICDRCGNTVDGLKATRVVKNTVVHIEETESVDIATTDFSVHYLCENCSKQHDIFMDKSIACCCECVHYTGETRCKKGVNTIGMSPINCTMYKKCSTCKKCGILIRGNRYTIQTTKSEKPFCLCQDCFDKYITVDGVPAGELTRECDE